MDEKAGVGHLVERGEGREEDGEAAVAEEGGEEEVLGRVWVSS